MTTIPRASARASSSSENSGRSPGNLITANETGVRIVDDVAGVRGRLARWIVLQEDARQSPLSRRENLVLIAGVLLGPLEEDAVEFLARDLLDGHLMDVRRPGERPPESTVRI